MDRRSAAEATMCYTIFFFPANYSGFICDCRISIEESYLTTHTFFAIETEDYMQKISRLHVVFISV